MIISPSTILGVRLELYEAVVLSFIVNLNYLYLFLYMAIKHDLSSHIMSRSSTYFTLIFAKTKR